MKQYKLALIGLGSRSKGLYNALKTREYVDIVATCRLETLLSDFYPTAWEISAQKRRASAKLV